MDKQIESFIFGILLGCVLTLLIILGLSSMGVLI